MKNFTYLAFCLVLISTTNVFAQDTASVTTNVTRITILNPGVSFELKTGRKQTFYVKPYITTLSGVGYSSSLGWTTAFNFDPSLCVQYRFYYNYYARKEKGKRTDLNSMNYIGPIYIMQYSNAQISDGSYVDNNRRPISELGFVWGMQRNYKDRFSFAMAFGPGIFFGKDRIDDPSLEPYTVNISEFTIVGQIELGIWLGRKD